MEPLLGGKLATGLPPKAVGLFKDVDSAFRPAAWALRWLWNHPEVTVVLSGMNVQQQLDENVGNAGTSPPGCLSEREAAVYGSVIKAFGEAYKVPCTGCNYCMPCPQKVNIPGCFAAYNMSFAAGLVSGLQGYITSTGSTDPNKNTGARNCVKCGKCEARCPQHIKISKELEAVSKKMEPFWVRAAIKVMVKFMR
jgi:predicted aldo/keto reductase-like oxidoreductase